MAKTTFFVILIAAFAGAAAGMAVQLLNDAEGMPENRPTERAATDVRQDEALEAIARLENEVEDLRLEVDDQRTENAQLAEEFAAFREQAKKAVSSPFTTEDGHAVDLGRALKGRLVGPGGKPLVFGGKASPGMKLAALPEEEKWEKLREELSLDSYQEEQLKQIAKDYRDNFKDIIKADDDGKITFGKLDLGKMLKAKADADERVKNLLSAEQHKKFKEGRYGAAMGLGGGGTSVAISTSFGSSEDK